MTHGAAVATGGMLAQAPAGNLSTTAHVFIVVATVITELYILGLLRRRQLRSGYALLWTVVGLVLLVLALFPGLLDRVSSWVGIDYPPALFLLLATGFLFLVVISFSRELSRLDERTRALAEEVALLRAEQEASHDGGQADPAAPGVDPAGPRPPR